jgi:hypothetical protein
LAKDIRYQIGLANYLRKLDKTDAVKYDFTLLGLTLMVNNEC